MKLYAHPFSSYSQKVLIALYANATPFEYRSLEEPSANAELAALWPLKRFPVLVDQGRTILEATTIIEHLQIHHRGAVRLIPDGDAGVEVRMLDRGRHLHFGGLRCGSVTLLCRLGPADSADLH